MVRKHRHRAESTPAGTPRLGWRKTWGVLVIILVAGALLRFAHLAEAVRAPDFDSPVLDSEHWDYWARALVSGDWTPPGEHPDPEIPTTPFLRPPGYAYFLAGVYGLTHGNYLAARLVQMVLGLGSVVLLFALASSLFGRRTGLTAAALMAVYWAFPFFEGELHDPALTIFLLLAVMNGFRWWYVKPSGLRALASGVLFGLYLTVRAEGILLAPFLACWMLAATRASTARRMGLRSALFLVLGMAVIVAPITYRNYVASGELVLISTGAGSNLYANNNDLADGTWPQMDLRSTLGVSTEWSNFNMPVVTDGVARKLGKNQVTHGEVSRFFAKRALAYIRKHPGRTLRLALRKMALFWGPAEVTNNKVLGVEKQHSWALRFLPGFPFALGTALSGLAMLGIDMWRRWRQRQALDAAFWLSALFLLFVVVSFLSILPFHVPGRYRLRVVPFLLIFSAYGMCRLATLIANRKKASAAAWGAATVALWGLCHVPLASYEYDMARWHYDRAQAYAGKGQRAEAEMELREALEANPNVAYYEAKLAELLDLEGREGEAAGHYRRALELDPHLAMAHNNLGFLLYERHALDEAIAHYRKAIEEHPLLTLARRNLGVALLEQGKPAEAIAQFETILKAAPEDRHADYHLGRAYTLQGNPEEALAHYERALHYHPENGGIANKIGLTLQELGRPAEAAAYFQRAAGLDARFSAAALVEQGNTALAGRDLATAIEAYRQATLAEPENRDAHFNLGVVLSAEGQQDEAAAHLEKAVALAPGDAEAVARLVALLAAQGRLEEAKARCQKAMEANPAAAEVMGKLIDTLEGGAGNSAVEQPAAE